MSWFTDANCEAESLREHVLIVYAVDLDFPSGHVRLHTGLGDLTIASNVYTGVGSLGSIADVPDMVQLTAETWSYALAYVDPATVPESEIDNCFGRSCTEYEVWIDPNTRATVGYEIRREGRMGKVRRKDGAIPVIEVNCENRLAILERADSWRFTTEHQVQFFAGDTGCDEAKKLDSIEILWGGKRVDPGQAGYYRHPNYRGG